MYLVLLSFECHQTSADKDTESPDSYVLSLSQFGTVPMRPNSQISIDLGSPVNARTSDICFRNKNRSNAFQQIRYKRDYYQPHKIIRHVLIFIEKTRNKKPNSKKWISNRLFYISAALVRPWWVELLGLWLALGTAPILIILKGFNVGRTRLHLGNICEQNIVPRDLVNLCRRESLRRIRNQRFVNQQDRMSSYSLFY